MAEQQMATLFDPNSGNRVAVGVGSQDAQSYFGQGYLLETPTQNYQTYQAQKTAPAPTPTTTQVGGNIGSLNVTTGGTTGTTGGTTTLEVSPGVYSSKSLQNYFDTEIQRMRPQYETAQGQLQTTTQALQDLTIPDFGAQYRTGFQAKINPLDTQIADIGGQVNTIDSALRNLESDVRQEIGGRAAESIIQAEIAKRAQPLIRQRQAFTDQLNTLGTQRQAAIQGLEKEIAFNQDNFDNQMKSLEFKRNLAIDTVNAFQTLLQQGQQASQETQDRALKLFTALIDQDPNFLNQLSAEEYAQLDAGQMPLSVLRKISEKTLAEQEAIAKLPKDAELRTIDGNLYAVQQMPDGTFRTELLIAKAAKGGGGSGGGGGTSYDPALREAALNAYYDEFQKWPSKSQEENAIGRYLYQLNQQPLVTDLYQLQEGLYGPVDPNLNIRSTENFRPFGSVYGSEGDDLSLVAGSD